MRYNVSREVSGTNVKIMGLGDGEIVTINTLYLMKNIINQSIRNIYVRRWAEKIVQDSTKDEATQIWMVYDFILSHTKYLKDPYGLEFIRTPPASLQMIEVGEIPSLDCDDLTVLSLSLLKSIGFPVALRVASYDQTKIFSHVYGLVRTKSMGWVQFDLVIREGPGFEAPGATNKMDMEV